MKSPSLALNQTDLASAAGRKAQKVQRKLHQAEAELHAANEMLVKAAPRRDKKELDAALEQNVAAEEKVHEAAEELEIVNELLNEATSAPQGVKAAPVSQGRTGHGVKSLMPHLSRKNGARP